MDYFHSVSCSKTSEIDEGKNNFSKEDEKWLTELEEICDKLELYANDGVVNTNRQYRFIESEEKNSQLIENIANNSSIDYSNENTSDNSTFDTRFTHFPQGNSNGIRRSSCIRSDPQHVLDDKEKKIVNYLPTSRIAKSEDDDTESDNIDIDIRRFSEMFSSTSREQNDFQSSTSIASHSREEYRTASNVSNRDAAFVSGSCMPESFETNEKEIFPYHTNNPTSTSDAGDCGISLGPRDDNLQDILRNYEEPQNHVVRATQISKDRKSKLCNSEKFLISVNNINVTTGHSSTTSMLQGHRDDRRFICEQCGRGFRQKGNLVTHYRTHTGEKPFACNKCVKKFRRSSHLAQHRRTHTGDKPFACDKCVKKFRSSSNLAEHRRSHTLEKPFACDKCVKIFMTSYHLAQHRRTHTGEKPFACDKCGKKFRKSCHLTEHRRTHTGEKPFICDTCGKRFRFSRNLVEHRHMHTEKN